MQQPMTLKLAKQLTGHASGLGRPSKMPGYSTSLPAAACLTGRRLAQVPGTSCSVCYAFERGRYGSPDVRKGLGRRLAALTNRGWTDGMVRLIDHYTAPADPYFRIHDSGDFQSVGHVLRWAEIASRLPHINFWAPTQERRLVAPARAAVGQDWPPNLVIRLSSVMMGEPPKKSRLPTSTVRSGVGFACRAYDTKPAHCGTCRACWDPNVRNVDYHEQ